MIVSNEVRPEKSKIKTQGVVYTPPPLAHFLASWAVRRGQDVVLDPTCGDGALLVPCCDRLRFLGGSNFQVLGVDIEGEAVRLARQRLRRYGCIVEGDVFATSLPQCDVLITNPPYVRSTLVSPSLSSRHLKRQT